jgi:colanic acid/amylovoran biosynthesis glycosyltransferase
LTWQTLDATQYGCQAASLSALYRLASLIAPGKHYDILHAHFGPVANSFRFARSLWRAPLVATFHGYDFCVVPREEGPKVYHPLFRTVDAVTVNSEYTRAKVIELGCAAERIHRLHVGLNLDQFCFRDRVRLPAEPVRLLSVGRLVEKKGLEYAIRALASVREHYPDLQYDIIGDGPLHSSLQQLTQQLGLGQNVVLHGARDSLFVQERMAAAHLFILPSVTAADGDQEGTPVSLMEAQASGLPVLSTRHSGIPEVVLDGVSGFLLPERDVEGLAQKLVYLIEHPEVCRAMGARGRQHVESQFDIRKLNEELTAIYEQTVARFDAREKSPHR